MPEHRPISDAELAHVESCANDGGLARPEAILPLCAEIRRLRAALRDIAGNAEEAWSAGRAREALDGT